jgi:hypothetical protein
LLCTPLTSGNALADVLPGRASGASPPDAARLLAGDPLKSAKALAEGAAKAAWRARLAIVLTGLVLLAVIDLWFWSKRR